jgi:hypothetical protein
MCDQGMNWTMLYEPLYFDFHGILLKAVSNDKESLSFIESDFSYFRVYPPEGKKTQHITLSVFFSQPPYDTIPEGTVATYHTKDAVVYKHGCIKYFDSFGKALVIFDHSHESAEIYSLDRDLLYEKSYLMIMTCVGKLLDQKKLHRIHAMGVVYEGKAILCLLPMGGGKTTLTLSLLESTAFSLLSEEVPLVSSKGLLYPFPIRMGVTEGTPLSIQQEFLKPFKRTHYQNKILIDMRYFKDRVASVAEPGFIFVGRRIYSAKPRIKKISRSKAFLALFRLCVMGLGLPQLLEYLLHFDFLDMVRQFPIFFSRVLASLSLLRQSKTYELHLGYDRAANAAFLADFVSRK